MSQFARRISGILLFWAMSFSVQAAEDLMGIYQQARDNDPQIKIAESELRVIEERKPQARAGLLPSLNAGASATREWVDGRGADSTALGYNLTLTQPVYNRGNRIVYQQADRAVARAEANYQSARQELMTRASQRYFDVLAAQDSLEFARNNKTAIQRQLEQTRRRFEVGLIAITDVQESKAGYDLAVAEEISALNQLNNAQEALREITGAYHDPLAVLKEEVPLVTPDPEKMEAWAKRALNQNPQITAAQVAVEIARQEIERQRANHHPRLDLVARHGYQDVDGGNQFSSGYVHNNSVGLELSLPVDISGAIRAGTREAQYAYQQALDNLEKARRAVQLQVHQAYLNVISGISRVKALEQAVVSNRTAYDATLTGFDVGTRTSVDVLNAQRELLRAQRDYANARYAYLQNTLVLKQATGILDEEDLAALNEWFVPPPPPQAQEGEKSEAVDSAESPKETGEADQKEPEQPAAGATPVADETETP